MGLARQLRSESPKTHHPPIARYSKLFPLSTLFQNHIEWIEQRGQRRFVKMSTNGYGTNGRNSVGQTLSNHVRNVADEAQPLLNGDGNSRATPKNLVNRLNKAARAEIKRDWADVVLIFCYIITGLLDSASISIWGSFVSMQTGRKRKIQHISTCQANFPQQVTPSISASAWPRQKNQTVGSNPAPLWVSSASAPSSLAASTGTSAQSGAQL